MIDVMLKSGKEKSSFAVTPGSTTPPWKRVSGQPARAKPRVVANDGRFLAYRAFSPKVHPARALLELPRRRVIDAAWFERRSATPLSARTAPRTRDGASPHLGEADGLQSIVDQYGDFLVHPIPVGEAEAHRELIADLLMKVTGARHLRPLGCGDPPPRGAGGPLEHLRGEEPPEAIEVVEDGVRYGVDVRVGHKTGFYVDQREEPPDGAEVGRRLPPPPRPRASRVELLLLHGRLLPWRF